MAKFQNKPSLADVARRRGQSLSDVLNEWGFNVFEHVDAGGTLEGFNARLRKRCLAEGVQPLEYSEIKETVIARPKNALVQLPAKADDNVGKKRRKGKVVTPDGAVAGDEHDGVDPGAPAGPEDPA